MQERIENVHERNKNVPQSGKLLLSLLAPLPSKPAEMECLELKPSSGANPED